MGAKMSALGGKWTLFAGWLAITSLAFTGPLLVLLRMSLSQDDSSYLIAIPVISGAVLFMERQKIFADTSTDVVLGGGLCILAACLALGSRLAGTSAELSVLILSLVMFWVAGFVFLFGRAASRAGIFPLLFAFLTAPPPSYLLDHVIHFLQASSAGITQAIFGILGVPVLREGMVFHLAEVNIEVARECSGIRSSMAIFILALLVVHFYLRSFWKKIFFLLCGAFIMILKNGIRIASLTLLAVHVDPGFLSGKLHQRGGVIFFLIGLLILFPVFTLLRKGEGLKVNAPSSH